MNLLGIVQAYTALAESLANNIIAGNIAPSSSADNAASHNPPSSAPAPNATAETAAAAPSHTGRGAVTSEKTVLPDAPQQKNDTKVASQSLIGLRAPGTTNAATAGLLSKLVTSNIAASHAAAATGDAAESEGATQESGTTGDNKGAASDKNALNPSAQPAASRISGGQSAAMAAQKTIAQSAEAASSLSPSAEKAEPKSSAPAKPVPLTNQAASASGADQASEPQEEVEQSTPPSAKTKSSQIKPPYTGQANATSQTEAQQKAEPLIPTSTGDTDAASQTDPQQEAEQPRAAQNPSAKPSYAGQTIPSANAPLLASLNPNGSIDQEAQVEDGAASEQPASQQSGATEKSAARLQQPTPQTMAALMRNLTGQTAPVHGSADSGIRDVIDVDDIRQETEITSATGQYADPRLPADKRSGAVFVPPQNASGANSADHNNAASSTHGTANPTEISENAVRGKRDQLAQASILNAAHGATSLGQASLEQSPFGQLLNTSRLGQGEVVFGTMGQEQMAGRMNGMDAAILNAAMIPGYPAPRPFAMPKQLPQGQAQRMQANEAEKAAQLGTTTQQKSKNGQSGNEVAIQNYLLNMGLKKSLMSKLRSALRPAKKKVKVMFGLAVLVTQVIFTLHTVLDELNQIEEEEDDMMHDPGEQKRRLKG